MKGTSLINRLSEKKKKKSHLGPKIAHPHNSGLALRTFFKF